jgi:hypothetical protein
MTRQTKTMLNALLLEEYKRENKISPSLKMGTYGFWVVQGYKPRKGEPSRHNCKLWTRNGLTSCWLWTEKQVNKIES